MLLVQTWFESALPVWLRLEATTIWGGPSAVTSVTYFVMINIVEIGRFYVSFDTKICFTPTCRPIVRKFSKMTSFYDAVGLRHVPISPCLIFVRLERFKPLIICVIPFLIQVYFVLLSKKREKCLNYLKRLHISCTDPLLYGIYQIRHQ